MKNIDVDELKQIQLDVLDAVHSFCSENDIAYSLSSGTLIGAVRHKGFIPWDDDIDICLLRSEYEKLENAFPEILGDKYVFKTINRDSQWNRAWGKIVDNRTVLKEDFNDSQRELQIGIDVFPMDDVPNNESKFSRWNRWRKVLVYAWSLKGMRYSANRSMVNNCVLLLSKIILSPLSLRVIAKTIDKYIKKPNGKGYSRVFESCDSLKALNNQDKADFSSYIDLEFEGKQYKAMIGYDDYLRHIYGDYMKLPPVEKRVSHHTFVAYWKD